MHFPGREMPQAAPQARERARREKVAHASPHPNRPGRASSGLEAWGRFQESRKSTPEEGLREVIVGRPPAMSAQSNSRGLVAQFFIHQKRTPGPNGRLAQDQEPDPDPPVTSWSMR